MQSTPRVLALVALAGFAFLTAGCSSNNKGKIEGRWKFVTFPEKTNEKGNGKRLLANLKEMGAYFYVEFRPDGTMTTGIGSDNPEVVEMFKGLAKADGKNLTVDAKYKLLPDDGVELYDLPQDFRGENGPFGSKDRVKKSVRINGPDMQMSDDSGTATLIKLQK